MRAPLGTIFIFKLETQLFETLFLEQHISMKELTPLDPSRNIRSEIAQLLACNTAPHVFYAHLC